MSDNFKPKTCRIIPDKNVAFSRIQVQQIVQVLLTRKFEKCIFIFEETPRIIDLLEILACECRKFNKCLFISQKPIFEFLPNINVVRYAKK